jgi:peptidyl-prolyl cis-trans isomerase D
MQTSFMPTSMFEPSPVVETQIPDVPHAGEALRDTYFGLQAGSAEVAPNQPKTIYYVMTLDRREPATFSSLYAPNGDEFRYKTLAREQAAKQQEQQWMGWLRQQAGLKSDWVPPDEAKREEAAKR